MTIPIIFAIDDRVVIACGVALTSLSLNAHPDTHYDAYIMHQKDKLSAENQEKLIQAFSGTANISISFVQTPDYSAIDISGVHISHTTYCRLDIPELFPQFDKVIYADIDMIFQQDLSALFQDSLQKGEWVAAALDAGIDDNRSDYFNAGFLVMNLKAMRENNVPELFRPHLSKKYEQNDQDILNIVCKGHVELIPRSYNFQVNHFLHYMWGRTEPGISFKDLLRNSTLHYTWIKKPWNSLECVAGDTWWHYYKLSPVYDDMFYFKRQQNQIVTVQDDFHRKTNRQLIMRILANIKHKILGKRV